METGRRQRPATAQEKVQLVLRLLRGEDLGLLSRESGITSGDLLGWRDAFLAGGRQSLADQRTSPTGPDAAPPRDDGSRELAELLPAIVFETALDGRITFTNDAGFRAFGYTREDLEQGVTVFDVLAPDQHRAAAENIQKVVQGEQFPPERYVALRKDGTTFPVMIHSAPIVHDGDVVGLRGVLLDITERQRAEELLHQSERKYRHLFENLNDAALLADAETGVILDANKRAEELLGRARGEIVGLHQSEIHPPSEAEKYRRRFAEHARRERVVDFDADVVKSDGRAVPVSISAVALTIGGRRMMLGLLRDITEMKKVEDSLRRARDDYLATANLTGDIIVRADTEGKWTFVNDAACAFWGKSREELIGQVYAEYLHPDDLDATAAALGTVERGKTVKGIVNRQQTPDGWRTVEWNTAPVFDEGGRYVGRQATGRDITERQKAEEIIRHRAHYDALTDLPNRVLFEERLTAALARARRENHMVAVLFLDLDRLKMVNDTFGHARGDEVIRQAARRVEGVLRTGDTVARLGGDEFAASLGALTSARDAGTVAWRILHALRSPFEIEEDAVYISASIGISLYPDHGENPRDLVKKADAAMYTAKDEGRNRLQFHTSEIAERAHDRVDLAADLRDALARGEFVLHYQPQVEAATGRVIAIEALLRWQHPQRGTLTPTEFLGVAEEAGLVDAIGEWVLASACDQARRWEKEEVQSPVPRVAVNLSARELHREGIADLVRAALERAGLRPDHLELEIRERAVTRNLERSLAIMEDLKALGVHLALDDFGIGHSSLLDLKRLPVDVLKIDQSFVRNVVRDENSQAIVEAIIAMARSLGLTTVAEGVETEGQLAFLREHGCDAIQGHLYSRPCSAESLPAVLAARRLWPGTSPSESAEGVLDREA